MQLLPCSHLLGDQGNDPALYVHAGQNAKAQAVLSRQSQLLQRLLHSSDIKIHALKEIREHRSRRIHMHPPRPGLAIEHAPAQRRFKLLNLRA